MDDFTAIIEEHFFPKISLSANAAYQPDAESHASVNSKIAVKRAPGDAPRYLCELLVTVDEKTSTNPPYFVDIVCVCFVTVDSKQSESEQRRTATMLSHQVLFPAVRELVLNLTARQPWGLFSIGMASLNIADDPPTPPPTIKPKRIRKKTT